MDKTYLLGLSCDVDINGSISFFHEGMPVALSSSEIAEAFSGLRDLAINPPKLRELSEDLRSEQAAAIRLVVDLIGSAIESGEVNQKNAASWLVHLTEVL